MKKTEGHKRPGPIKMKGKRIPGNGLAVQGPEAGREEHGTLKGHCGSSKISKRRGTVW